MTVGSLVQSQRRDFSSVSYDEAMRRARADQPIESSNPIVGDPKRFIDPLLRFRQFCCLGCGRPIENEIALAEEPLLVDVELARK
jgi:hypothetical protein